MTASRLSPVEKVSRLRLADGVIARHHVVEAIHPRLVRDGGRHDLTLVGDQLHRHTGQPDFSLLGFEHAIPHDVGVYEALNRTGAKFAKVVLDPLVTPRNFDLSDHVTRTVGPTAGLAAAASGRVATVQPPGGSRLRKL